MIIAGNLSHHETEMGAKDGRSRYPFDKAQLPTEISIDPNSPMPSHNPAEIAMLKADTGKTFTELMGEGAEMRATV